MTTSIKALRKDAVALLALAAAILGLTVAFVLPSLHSGAHQLRVGVSGPGTAEIAERVQAAQPGGFDIRTYQNPSDVRAAITDRHLVGGIVTEDGDPQILIASGAGNPIAQALKGIASNLAISSGHPVAVHDLAPTTHRDPQAAGISALGVPLLLGGYGPGMLVILLITDSVARRLGGVITFSGVLGLAIAAFLRFGSGTIDGHFWAVAGAVALGSMAISVLAVGLNELIGKAGLVLTVVAMLVVGNPLSGLTTGWEWLPSGWGAFGQLLPPGASGELLRSLAFFDGAGALRPALVLLTWIAAGIGLYGLSWLRHRALRRTSADRSLAGNVDAQRFTESVSV